MFPPLRLRLPLHPCDAHEHLFVLDRDPAREHFHCVFKVGVEEDFAGAVDEGGGGGVEDVEAAVEGGWGEGERGARVWVAEEHEDVPDAELGGERDGVIEEGQVPAGAVGGGGDVVFVLFASALGRPCEGHVFAFAFGRWRTLTSFAATSPFPSQSFSNSSSACIRPSKPDW